MSEQVERPNPNIGAKFQEGVTYLMHNESGKILPYHIEFEKMVRTGDMTKVCYKNNKFRLLDASESKEEVEPVKVSQLAKKPLPKKSALAVDDSGDVIAFGNPFEVEKANIGTMLNTLNAGA